MFGAVLQTARLCSGELGSGFIQTFLRVREQTYSNLVGLHVIVGSHATEQRFQHYANAVGGRSNGTTPQRVRWHFLRIACKIRPTSYLTLMDLCFSASPHSARSC
jgi:hypothetical protein